MSRRDPFGKGAALATASGLPRPALARQAKRAGCRYAAKSLVQYNILKPGGVAEWLKARLSKSRILARESKVQILSPPLKQK